MSSIMHTRALPAVLLLALAACDAAGPAAPTLPAPAPGSSSSSITLRCSVSVSDAEMRCEPAGPGGARGDLMLGGQGTYVRLASTNVSYNGGTQTLQGDVTVQNLLSEALGTPDGSTVTGVKVFFLSGPTVTSGTGTADVQNADGMGTFTTTNQPYFLYNQVLLPRGTSAARTWKFDVSPTVGTFAFTVAVAGKAPSEAGALRWTVQNGTPGTEHADAVWGTSPSNVFVGAQGGVIKHWDGTSWTELVTAAAKNVDCIHGASPTDVWAVGDFGLAEHYDGNSWTATPVPGGAYLYGVWDAGGGIAYAVGINGAAMRWNGASWTVQPTPAGTPYLEAVWGASATNVFAVG
ncbi:MAG: hypothetical protein JO306_03025, partial [Gemmatimonadetes bacterium]|nr:hypothetical protein [Gemmatimonadota bacterium]